MRWRAGQDAAWEGGIERENPLKADKRRRGGGAKEKAKKRRRRTGEIDGEAAHLSMRRGGGAKEKAKERRRHRGESDTGEEAAQRRGRAEGCLKTGSPWINYGIST